jgi:hypothetical protein
LPAPKKYRNTTPFLFNPELDRFNEFKELCHREKKSISEKLNELIVQAIETDGIGEDNPLGIMYGPVVQRKITNFNVNNPLETLDWFIENGIIRVKDWQPAYAEVQDKDRMEKYVNLTYIMHSTAEDRLSFLKTSKAVVRTGKVQQLPTMKGTRSGF